jgi:folate-binding protein YgfZ
MIIHPMTTPTSSLLTPSLLLHGLAPLPHLGVIRAEGADAASFLHNQLTQDFALLGLSDARLCALCTAKGRMLASFIGFKRSPTDILLVCSQDILAATLKRLAMFVMRAKVKLSDATADFQIAGLIGNALDSVAPIAGAAWSKQDIEEAALVNIYPANGQRRALWIAPTGTPLPLAANLNTPVTAAQWQWTEVQSGVATLTQPIVEAFVPQMLNYESVGGVSFKKGCYPGQEIVARSQFRGTLKRRAYLVHADVAMHAGQEVFTPGDAEQPCGLVVQAAAAPDGGWSALVSVQTASIEGGLRLARADGEMLTVLPLPYALLEDI